MGLTKIDDRGLNTPIDLLDNEKIRLGTGNDLQIYHDGSHSFVEDTGTGQLRLCGDNGVVIRKGPYSDVMINAVADGSVELFHDNSKKFETTSTGVTVSGDASTGTIIQGAFSLRDTSSSSDRIKWIPNSPYVLRWADNFKASFGFGDDLQIYHDGTHSYLYNTTGELKNRAAVWKVVNAANSEKIIEATENGSVDLYYDNSKKLATDPTGVTVTGNLAMSGEINMTNGGNVNRFIDCSLSNGEALFIRSTQGGDTGHQNMALFHRQGAVELYHANSKKFETVSDGIYVTGHVRVGDDSQLVAGTGSDLQISHSSTFNNTLFYNNTNDVYFRSGTAFHFQNKAGNENYATLVENAQCQFFYDNTIRLQTTNYGSRTTGYHTQSTAIGFQGDNADWTSSTRYMHNMSLMWDSGHFVNSTGTFTCPVAGKYLCSATVQAHRANNPTNSSGQYYNVLWQKNNSNYHVEMVGTVATNAAALGQNDVNGKHEQVTATIIMDCAANDTIRAHSNHGYRNDSQNICSVYLLG